MIDFSYVFLLFGSSVPYARRATKFYFLTTALEATIHDYSKSPCEHPCDSDPECLAELLPPGVTHLLTEETD
jgi:hypothetical protein